MRISRQLARDAFFGFVLLLASGAMEVVTARGATSAESSGSPLMKLLWAGVYLVVIVRMLPYRRQVLELLRMNKAFVALILLAILSARWSLAPGATLSKSIPLLLSALVGLDFARRYTVREQLRLLWIVLAGVMVAGVIVQLFFPGILPSAGDDEIAATAWRGIVTTKNTWARLVVLTGVVILSMPRPTRASLFRVGFLMVLIFGLLAASRSAGGLVVMAAMMAAFAIFPFLRWRRRKAVILVGIGLPAVLAASSFYLVTNLTSIMAAMGKDPTMTGRLPIWRACLRAYRNHPLLGYGFSAFWSEASRPARLVREVSFATLAHAHDGYIDILLGLGCIGLILYVTCNAVAAWRAARYIRGTRGQAAMWPMAFLCVVLLYQIDESSIVAANQLLWILFSSVIFSLAIEARELDLLPAAHEPAYEEEVLVAGD